MRPFVHALPLVLLLAVAGCRSGALVDDADESILLPLAPGNAWSYLATQVTSDSTVRTGTLRLTVTGVDTIGREPYAVLAAEWSGEVEGPEGTYGFFRNTEEGLVRLTPDAGYKFVYRFPLRGGTRYTMPSRAGLRAHVVVRRVEVMVPAGRYDAHVYAVDEPIGGAYEEAFAPGVGLVRMEREELTLVLERAEVP